MTTVSSNLLTTLTGIRNDANLDDAAKRITLQAAATTYSGTNEALKTKEKIQTLVSEPVLTLAELISAKREDLTHDSLPDTLSEDYLLTTAQIANLQDSLLANILTGGSPEIREIITNLLKLAHLVTNYTPQLTLSELRRLAQSQVLLPSSIFPLPTIKKAPSPQRPTTQQENSIVEGLASALEETTRLIEQLSRLQQRQEKRYRRKTQEEQLPRNLLLEADWDNLTQMQRNLLSEQNIEIGDDLSDAIQSLKELAQTQYNELWKYADHSRKVVITQGGVFQQTARTGSNSVSRTDTTQPNWTEMPQDPYENFFAEGRPRMRCISVGDYIRIEQTICCYEPTEVAHIENVLQGEMKENTVRQFQQQIREEFTQSDTEEETTKDSQTTDRFEMQKEMEKTMQMDASLSLGATFSAQYGTVNVGGNSNFASSYSSSQAEHQAVNHAKELTERTLTRIRKRVQQERKTKLTQEFELTNKHILDNRGNTQGHVVGLYRWVEKIYNAQLVNYGKRVMMEFMIPEPAAFHLWAMTQRDNPADALVLDEPVHPKDRNITYQINNSLTTQQGLLTAQDINDYNYAHWAAAYNANVEAPPIAEKKVSLAIVEDIGEKDKKERYLAKLKNDYVVEEGYQATYAIWAGMVEAGQAKIGIGHTMGWATGSGLSPYL